MIRQTLVGFVGILLSTALFSCSATPAPKSAASPQPPPAPPAKIQVMVITGGHGFNHDPFFKLFIDNPEIVYREVEQGHTVNGKSTDGKDAIAYDRGDLLDYDVIVLYDFQLDINDAQKAAFESLFDKGVGLIVLHHAILSYQDWPEYERIAGGKYLLDTEKVGPVTWPESTYTHEMTDIPVKVVAKTPITAGISDFTVHDELYRGVRMTKDISVLLTAEGKPLAWTRQEKNSRVVTIMIGHGPAYADANFQKLLAQSIRWAAKRS